ncbi:MAG: hypothetical protein KGI69_00575 [Patescibacteria group bacterium]|nr:hypothetical protein [Patescibacteria group bacterium]
MNPNEGSNNTNGSNTCSCKCGHHKLMPIAVMLIALDILLANFGVYSWYVATIIWPILLIVAASGKLCKCCGCK